MEQIVLRIARYVCTALSAKDLDTGLHSWRVAESAAMLARAMGMSHTEARHLEIAALLHDVGKLGISNALLKKSGALTEAEYGIMKKHTSIGAELVTNVLRDDGLGRTVFRGVLYHHERYDGMGYPHGLKGSEIPLEARIVAVVDAVDAMGWERVYHGKRTVDFVKAELRRCGGMHFDPDIAALAIRLLDNGRIDCPKEGEGKNAAEILSVHGLTNRPIHTPVTAGHAVGDGGLPSAARSQQRTADPDR